MITIIGILIALLLPAVQAAREAARSMQCSNNLKQMSLGVLTHEQAQGIFPDGGDGDWASADKRIGMDSIADREPGAVPMVAPNQNWGWLYQTLPYIEQENLWRMTSVVNIMKTPLGTYSCPSRLAPRIISTGADYGRGIRAMTDYAGNAGTSRVGEAGWGMMGNGLDAPITRRPDGTSERGSSVSINYITDGTSNTLLAGEKCMNLNFIGSGQPDDDSGWVDGWDFDNIRWGYFQPHADYNSDLNGILTNTALRSAFGSSHNGFFNAALCDGSVRSIQFVVSSDVFAHLSSRIDGQVLDGSQY